MRVGVAVPLIRPHGCVPSDSRREPGALEPAFDEVAFDALLEVDERVGSGSSPDAFVGRAFPIEGDPLVVVEPHGVGESAGVALIEGWEVTANHDRRRFDRAGEVERDQPGEGLAQRRVHARAGTNAQPNAGGGGIEHEPVGFVVEPVGQMAEQHHAGRAERGQPEGFDVQAARIEAQRVEDGIAPRLDSEVDCRRRGVRSARLAHRGDSARVCQVVSRGNFRALIPVVSADWRDPANALHS